MKNIDALLKAAGYEEEHVVKTTCFLADIADFAAFNEVYADDDKAIEALIRIRDALRKYHNSK